MLFLREFEENLGFRILLYLSIKLLDLHITYLVRKLHLFLLKNNVGLDKLINIIIIIVLINILNEKHVLTNANGALGVNTCQQA